MSIVDPKPNFLRVFDAFVLATGYSEVYASRLVLNAGHRIADIKGGANPSFVTMTKAVERMSELWPKDKASLWPRVWPRPKPSAKPLNPTWNKTDIVSAR